MNTHSPSVYTYVARKRVFFFFLDSISTDDSDIDDF